MTDEEKIKLCDELRLVDLNWVINSLKAQVAYDAEQLKFYQNESSLSLLKRAWIRWWHPTLEKIKSVISNGYKK